jgi:hypothetical protein
MPWEVVTEEMPSRTCRRCDVAWYADDDADAEDRVNLRAPSGVVHIQRTDVGREQTQVSAALLVLLRGGKATYCGLEVK